MIGIMAMLRIRYKCDVMSLNVLGRKALVHIVPIHYEHIRKRWNQQVHFLYENPFLRCQSMFRVH